MGKVRIPKSFVGKPKDYPEENLTPAEVKRRFMKILGPFAKPSVPLRLRVTAEKKLPGNVIRQHVLYDVEPGESVPAYHLFLKDLPKDAPGVLSIHCHGAIFKEGKDYHSQPKPKDPVQHSYNAALRGFRVLAPDALCFGERRKNFGYSKDFFEEILDHAELCSRGKSFAWKSVWDNSRAIEVLESFGSRRIGVMGHSGGSTQSYILTSVNPKVKAAVCVASFATLRHQFYQERQCHCLYHYIPGMMEAGIDWDQVVALSAPRKIFFAWGEKELGIQMHWAFVNAVRARCRKEKLPNSAIVHVEKGVGHVLTGPLMDAAFKFLAAELR